MPYHALRLELSKEQKKELFLFMKSTHDKEEYKRTYAVKQKMEGAVPLNCTPYQLDNFKSFLRDTLEGTLHAR